MIRLLLIVLALVLAPIQVTAQTTYYVATTGNNGNSGTEGSPWRDIDYADTQVSAGDTVIIRGGTYDERVTLATTGTAGNVITYQNYTGENVIIDGTTPTVPAFAGLFDIGAMDYITLQGGVGGGSLTVRDSDADCIQTSGNSVWITIDTVVVDTCAENGIIFYNQSTADANTIVRDSTITNATQGGIVVWASGLNGLGPYLFDGNTVNNWTGSGNWDAIQVVDARGIAVIDNIIHDPVGTVAGVDWIDIGGSQDDNPTRTYNVLVQGNVHYNGGSNDNQTKANSQPEWTVYRRNELKDIGFGYYEHPHSTFRSYHNTIFSPDGYCFQLWNGDVPTNWNDEWGGITHKNNLCVNPTGAQVMQHSPNSIDADQDHIVMEYNCYRPNTGFDFTEWQDDVSGGTYASTVTGWNNWRSDHGQEQLGTPANRFNTSQTDAQIFVDPTANPPNLNLVEGAFAIDEGGPLTTTVNSGTTATVVDVDDAAYFQCWFGTLYPCDDIIVGANPAVTITSINKTTQEITVDTAITWSNGDSVYLAPAYTGSAPDCGALERLASPPMGGVRLRLADEE